MAIVLIIWTIALLCLGYLPYNLLRNYIQARKIGLPVVLIPLDPFSPLAWTLGPLLFPIFNALPIQRVRDWAAFAQIHWPFGDQGGAHKRFGSAFLIVSPASINLVTNDPGAVEDVLRQINKFLKPKQIYENIETYGPNVDTVNGDAWQRHRRLTTPPFNEKNSGLVWKESLKQAQGMLSSWVAKGDEGEIDTSSGTMTLALHVLTGAGFGKSYDYAGTSTIKEGHQMSYRDVLKELLSNMLLIVLATKIQAPDCFLPKAIKRTKFVIAEFKKHMMDMVEEERAVARDENMASHGDNLMSALVRSNELSKADGKQRYSLTEEELYGNLFIWSLAGHDTTATTLVYAFYLLSAYPEVQEWVSEEINHVTGDTPAGDWDYEAMFPKLKRCLAVMYETLRMYGPVAHMNKITNGPQSLSIAGREYDLPADCFLTLNLIATHMSEDHWSDADTWKPARHLDEDENMILAKPGTLIPWVQGPRVCPGKKFAQVEFVAVIATCLRNHRVYPVVGPGESKEQTQQRVLETLRDSDPGVTPTLKMLHPERVRLRWVKVA